MKRSHLFAFVVTLVRDGIRTVTVRAVSILSALHVAYTKFADERDRRALEAAFYAAEASGATGVEFSALVGDREPQTVVDPQEWDIPTTEYPVLRPKRSLRLDDLLGA